MCPSEVSLRQRKGVLTDPSAHHAARQIIGRRVNSAPYPRQTRLIGSVLIRRPLKYDIHAWPVFKYQELLLGTKELAEPAGKELRAG